MRNSKTLEFMSNLNEKINKDNIEINKAIANAKRGHNLDRIKNAGYDIEWDGDRITNKETGKSIWPSEIDKTKKDKIDFKGMLDNPRPRMDHTKRWDSDVKDNKIPKSAKVNKGVYNNDELDSYSPRYNSDFKKSISKNVNNYKKAVKDRDENLATVKNADSSMGYYKKQVDDAQKRLDWHKEYRDNAQADADRAEQRRKNYVDDMRKRKEELQKNKVNNESVVIKPKNKLNERQESILNKIKSLKESVDSNFVDNACDLIADYLYHETGRDEVSWSEIKDYIYNDVCDDELHDYNPSSETMEAIKKRLENGGYTVLNESKKETLNEEEVGSSIISLSGKFYIGDPCYVLSDDIYYGVWDDKYNFKDGQIYCEDGLAFIVHGTAWGDGEYDGTNGKSYGVDSGTLAVIPIELVSKEDGLEYGSVETSNAAELEYEDGLFKFKFDDHTVEVDTDPSEMYDSDEDDGPWDPENYDDYEEDGDEDYYRENESEEPKNEKPLNEEVSDEAYEIAHEIAKEIRYRGCLTFTTVNERIYDLSNKSQEEIDNSDFINDVYGCLNYEGINQNQSTGDFYTEEYAKENPDVLEESKELNEEWLEPEYDSAVSFYKKARVEGNKLYSYDTLVAEIKDGNPVVYGTYSQTTLRHIKEWLKQNGFKAENSKQIMNDYGVKNDN